MSNTKESLIEGFIYHGPGACPVCFTPLVVIDTEHNVIDLDSEGQAVDIRSYIECRAACPNCGNKIPMRLNGIYAPYSKNAYNLKMEEIKSEIDHRNAGRYSITENPLVECD